MNWVVSGGGFAVIATVAMVYFPQSKQMVRTLLTQKPDAVFCAGYDPKSGEVSTVQIPKQAKNKGRIQVYTAAGLNDLSANLKYDDLDGLIEPGPNQKPYRISIRVSETEKLQVYRECGARPICRFERIFHMAPSEFKKAESKYVSAEKVAFDARREAAELSEKYGIARSRVIALQAQVEAAKLKRELESKQMTKAQAQKKIAGAPTQLLKAALDYVLLSAQGGAAPQPGGERSAASSSNAEFEAYKKALPPGSDVPLEYAALSTEKADELFQKAKAHANDLAGQMHQVNVGAHSVSRQAKQMQQDLESRGTRAELKDLIPSHLSDWCSQ